ncbi:MAG: gliding motility-associated C-terminal domain-containing protein [Saprospiraceae bacterium]
MKLKFLFVIFFSSFTFSTFAQSNFERWAKNTSRATDSLELVDFFKQTRGDLWKEKWIFSDPLEDWYGVFLNENGRVFCIDLDGDPFCNSVKHGGNHLHGKLPDLTLPFLEHLFLSSNKVSGKLPSFDNTPNLLTMNLSGNRFSGTIPSFSNLQKLVKIDLEYNVLYGELPNFELRNLESLYLSHNYLSGKLPDLNESYKLKHLFVNNNQLNGKLPRFKDLRDLRHLFISHNYFSGSFPDYSQLSHLEILLANDNELEGCYMRSNYSDLKRFSVENNFVHVCQISDFNIPNGFSPNGDGVNDVLDLSVVPELIKSGVKTEFMVWNSKKMLVYTDEDFDGTWEGNSNINGSNLEEGLYIYWLKSGTNVAKGTVYIRQ